jgi:transposase
MPTILPDPAHLRLDHVRVDADIITLVVAAKGDHAYCPLCSQHSDRVHSHYVRSLADLPWNGVTVQLQLTVRRFFCDVESCPRRIFAELLPTVAAPYARRTVRLTEVLELVGFVAGGEAGARLLMGLGIATSPDTVLRVLRRAVLPEHQAPEVLGVDDFAFRRGKHYGSILIDLERHSRVDLLPDRTAETLGSWLTEHPGVEVVSRDRGGAYADGSRQGAPDAVQVADRFHLVVNLREMLERFLVRKQSCLRKAAQACLEERAAEPTVPDAQDAPAVCSPLTQAEQQQSGRRARRLERFDLVRSMREQGIGINSIARHLRMGRHTVRRFLRAETFPERAPRAPRPGILTPYEPYLRQRWSAGCQNAHLLFQEIQAKGFPGSASYVRHVLARWRPEPSKPGRKGKNPTRSPTVPPTIRPLSPRQASWLLVRPPPDLDAEEQTYLEQLCRLAPDIAAVYHLAQEFRRMVRERDHAALEGWLVAAEQTEAPEVIGFAAGIRRDRAAVDAALTTQWNNAQCEGQINRLKVLKRQMYGRAKFDLLRKRVLHAS